jgi:hypothetical protein
LFLHFSYSYLAKTKHNRIKTGVLFGCFGQIAFGGRFRLLIPAVRNYSLFSYTTNWRNKLSTLSVLKLTAAQKPTQMSGVQQRRNKLAKRVHEQIELLKAQQAGTTYAPIKFRTYKDTETGARKQIEVAKRVKCWWFGADNGKLALSVRYGSRVLELAKGKFAIEVANERDLLSALELVKSATLAGELDGAIDNASNKLRAGFAK